MGHSHYLHYDNFSHACIWHMAKLNELYTFHVLSLLCINYKLVNMLKLNIHI